MSVFVVRKTTHGLGGEDWLSSERVFSDVESAIECRDTTFVFSDVSVQIDEEDDDFESIFPQVLI